MVAEDVVQCRRSPVPSIEELAPTSVIHDYQKGLSDVTRTACGVLPREPNRSWCCDPVGHCAFCRLIRTTEAGRELCLRSDRSHLDEAERRGSARYLCDAGLWDIASPIRVCGQIVGYLFTGQCRPADGKAAEQQWEARVRHTAGAIGVDPDLLLTAGKDVRRVTESELGNLEGQLSRVADQLGKVCWHYYAQRIRNVLLQRLGRELSEEGIKEILCDAVEQLFGRVSIMVTLRDGNEMRPYATRGISPDALVNYQPGQGYIGWAAANNQALLTTDLKANRCFVVDQEMIHELPNDLARPNPAFENVGSNSLIESVLTVPLGDGPVEVVLQVAARNVGTFTPADVLPLRWIGEAAVLASDRMRLLRSVEDRARALPEKDRRLKALLALAIDQLGGQWGDVWSLNARQELSLVVTHSSDIKVPHPLTESMWIRGDQWILGRAVRESKTIAVSESCGDKPPAACSGETPYDQLRRRVKMAVAVPLRDATYRIIGVMCITRFGDGALKMVSAPF